MRDCSEVAKKSKCGMSLGIWRGNVAVTDTQYIGSCSTRLACQAAV